MKSNNGTPVSNGRMVFIYSLVIFIWSVLILRLGIIQIVNGKEYGDKAEKQSSGKIKVPAERGLIFDRKGRQLAENVIGKGLYAYASDNKEIRNIYKYLDRIYGRRAGTSKKLYSLKPNRFKYIDRTLPDELAERMANDSIPGLYIEEGVRRDYPFGAVGKQLLGCTNIDGCGISGLEFSYDSLLAGTPGLIDYLRDAHRNTYRIQSIPLVKPIAGNSMVLTLDWYFQEIVEEELKAAVIKYNALEGTAIFLDCNTGEILAAADYIAGEDNDAVKLRAVSNCIEPGSVFKVFTAAALMDEGLIDYDEKIYCENGMWKCGRGRLRDDKKHDSLIFQDIIELSSNIGTGKLALRLGGEKLTEAAKRFGFGQPPYIGLPGEQAGHIGDPGVWSEYNVAALSIGHSISVTPVQLAAGMAAIANGGKLYRPLLIRGIINNQGKLTKKAKPLMLGEVMEKKNAELLHTFLSGVVERGTATPVKSDIVSIAGKTGTAEVVDLKNGGYIKNKFVASFLGFFPAEEPKVAGVVVLHQPEPVHYGGYTSGPAFKNIAERYTIANSGLLRPDTKLAADEGENELIEVPDFIGRDVSLAMQIAEKKGLKVVADRDEGVVAWQYPPEGRRLPGNETVAVIIQSDDEKVKMLDLSGLKIRSAIAVLNYQGLNFEIEGRGKVKKQYPSAGATLEKNVRCRLVCATPVKAKNEAVKLSQAN
ncbi:MAG: penicillin-binding transpeptidase domain-containing protein [Candidatus Zixiibacteriota bacterium]